MQRRFDDFIRSRKIQTERRGDLIIAAKETAVSLARRRAALEARLKRVNAPGGSAESEGLLVPPGATIVKVTRMAAAPEAPWRPPGVTRE